MTTAPRPADSAAPGRNTALTPAERRLAVIAFAIVGVAMVAFTLAASSILSAVHSASDEAAYLKYAHNILNGGYAVAGQQQEGLYLWHTPGLPLLIAPLVWLGIPIEVIRLIGPLCLIASGVLLMVILRRFVRPWVAIAAGLLLCLYPPFWRLLPQLFAEPPALLLGLAGFEALIRYAERRRIGWAITAGLAFGAMIMFRPEYGYMALAALVLAILALAHPRWRAVARPAAVSCAVAMAVCLPWLAYTYSKTHVPLYWTASSGESLYWMSSPSPGETGSWQTANADFTDPNLAPHRALFRRLAAMPQLQANRELTRVAIDNIEQHPGSYLRHLIDNGERIFLGIPFSFEHNTAQNLAFYGLPDIGLLVVALAGSVVLSRRRERLPGRLVPIVAFAAVSLAWHLPVAAYPRMATLSIPAFLILAALGFDRWITSRARKRRVMRRVGEISVVD